LSKTRPFYAKRVSEALVQRTIRLDELPRQGRKVPELNQDVVREVPQYSYRILYEIKETNIDILAVIHKRKDLQVDEIPREE